jgi:PAS domain S-box-containing protein
MSFSIRLKLVSFTFCLVLLVGGTICVYSIYQGRERILTTFEREAFHITGLISKTVANPLYSLDVYSCKLRLGEARMVPTITYTYVTDPDGILLVDGTEDNVLAGQKLNDPFSRQVLLSNQWVSSREGETLKVGGPILMPDDSCVGLLQVGFSLKPADQIIAKSIHIIVTLTFICLAIGALLAFALSTRFSGPVLALVQAARQIGEGQLSTRLELKRGDELGLLAKSFNRMAINLSTTVAKIDKIIESMADSLLVLNLDLTINTVNQATLSLLGYQRTELVGKPAAVLTAGEELFNSSATDKLIKEGSVTGIEKTYVAQNGRKIPVAFSASVLSGEGGAIQGIVCVAQDITERKEAEEALRQSEERLRRVIQDMPALLVAFDERGQIIAWNRECEEVTGFSAEEVILNPQAPEQLYRDPAQRQQVMSEWCRPAEDFRDREWDLSAKDASIRTVSWSNLSRVFPVPGWASWAVGIDVTERRRAQAERESMQDQLLQAQKLESLGVLAGGIAHDFNNLLTGMLGNAELALVDVEPASRAKRSIEQVIRASNRAADLTGKLLAYAGKGALQLQPLDLSQQVRELSHLLATAMSKKVVLRLELAEGLPAVEGDPAQIQQVVMNLVLNAAESYGDIPGTVTVTTGELQIHPGDVKQLATGGDLPPGWYVYFEVQDNGCGMDEAIKTKIFDPFFTTKFKGRGLGLAAVLGIVRSHRGGLQVSSAPGQGTRFQVFFPASDQLARTPRRDSSSNLAGEGLILVVDDEPLVLGLARDILEQHGYRVLTAENGRKGLELFRRRAGEIDLLLLDLTMPEMGGEETLRAMRAIRSDLPVLLSSGYSEQEAADQLLERGLAEFLQKPYSPQALAAKVKEMLSRSVKVSMAAHPLGRSEF